MKSFLTTTAFSFLGFSSLVLLTANSVHSKTSIIPQTIYCPQIEELQELNLNLNSDLTRSELAKLRLDAYITCYHNNYLNSFNA